MLAHDAPNFTRIYQAVEPLLVKNRTLEGSEAFRLGHHNAIRAIPLRVSGLRQSQAQQADLPIASWGHVLAQLRQDVAGRVAPSPAGPIGPHFTEQPDYWRGYARGLDDYEAAVGLTAPAPSRPRPR